MRKQHLLTLLPQRRFYTLLYIYGYSDPVNVPSLVNIPSLVSISFLVTIPFLSDTQHKRRKESGNTAGCIFEYRMLNFHKSHASRQQDDTYLMKKHYLCSPIMGERLRIPVDEYGIAVSLAGHGGS